jgi:hypothetical protein
MNAQQHTHTHKAEKMGNGYTLLLIDGLHGIHCIDMLVSLYGDRLSTTEKTAYVPLSNIDFWDCSKDYRNECIEDMIGNGELFARTNDNQYLRVEWRDGDIIGVNLEAVYCEICDDYEEAIPDNATVYQVLSSFLSALINSDNTGLNDDERIALDAFEQLETNGLDDWHWSYNPNHSNEFGLCEITGLRGVTSELHLVNMG